jgi:hypothetical protein
VELDEIATVRCCIRSMLRVTVFQFLQENSVCSALQTVSLKRGIKTKSRVRLTMASVFPDHLLLNKWCVLKSVVSWDRLNTVMFIKTFKNKCLKNST